MKKDILIIGDAHTKPGVSNDRFEWLGKWARERKPDIIVDMGDWEDMPSLSGYDVGKKSYEGRSYLADISAASEARSKFNFGLSGNSKLGPTKNKGAAGSSNKGYKKIALGGNHSEGRISRVIEEDRKLDGLIGIKDFQHDYFGWDYVPYLEPIDIQGFLFSHYFPSGVMGRAIGGEMPSLSLLRKQLTSCVSGHLHLFDISHRTTPTGVRRWGIFSGCFLAKEQWEIYAGPSNKMWWKGAVLLRGCEAGDFDSLEIVSVVELEKLYGTKKRTSR